MKMSIAARILRFAYMVMWWITRTRQKIVKEQRNGLEFWSHLLMRPGKTRYVPEQVNGLKAEWIIPNGSPDDKVIYYLHGGAYAMGSIHTHRRLIANIAKSAGIQAFALEYSLSPEVVFPVALNQAVEGFQYLLNKGFKHENIVIAGDSAGGGLSVATMLKLRDLGKPLPGAAVLLSPWTDVEGVGNSNRTANQHDPINNYALQYYGKLYAAGNDMHNPLISPCYADMTGLPPILAQVSQTELLFDDTNRLAERAKAAGVDFTLQSWYGLVHVWQVFDFFVPESREAIRNIGRFTRQKLNY
jgi:acetyl esterase/lipase